MNLLDPIEWALVLLALGCGLLILEVFIPSGGILSFLAFAAVVGSTVMAFQRNTTTGLGFIAIALVAVPLAIGLGLKLWPSTPLGRAMLGQPPTEDEVRPDNPRRHLVGRVGVAQSLMLPSGAILIDGQLVDAVSQGIPIEPGEPVVVVEVRANRVMVRPAKPDEVQQASLPQDNLLSRPIEEFGLEDLDDQPLS